MKLTREYKLTELGVLPTDWDVRSIQQLGSVKTGPFGTILKASEYSGGDGVPVISVGEIRQGFLRVTEETPRVNVMVTRRLPQYVLKEGDIVFGRKGAVDRSSLIRSAQCGWFLGSDGISVRPTQEHVSSYLAFQFQSGRVQSWLVQHAIGTTMPSLNQEILLRAAIPLPPTRTEQEAIAEALSDTDALIESLEQFLAKKRQIKQGAMQELLTGKRRLPGFQTSARFRKAANPPIPEDWDFVKLTSVAELESGHTPSRRNPRYWGGGIPWVSLHDTDALNGREIHVTAQTVSREGIANSSARILPAGTVVFSRTATVGKTTVLGREMATSQDFANYICGPSVHNHFLVYLFRHMAPEWKRLMAGSIHNTVYMPIFKALQVSLPKSAEQEAITEVLSDMDAEITALEEKLTKVRQLKQGMMQELLTGRIRLV